MQAVYVAEPNATDPLAALCIGDRPKPPRRDGWVTVRVHAAALNHHDLWTLRGVGIKPDAFPMILGCDAAGLDENSTPVIVHPVISTPGWSGDETLDPDRTLLSEKYQGTLAEFVSVPARNLLPKPSWMSMEEAACVPTTWLTAYRMLFTQANLKPGQTVLVQGATGGVSTALIMLARAAGLRVFATARSDAAADYGREIGAHEVFEMNARLPSRIDAVMDSIGAATWSHSVKVLRPGGVLVTTGATSGDAYPAELRHIFFRQLRVMGSTMGTRDELQSVINFLDVRQIRPVIHETYTLDDADRALAALDSGGINGKIVLRLPHT